jgi:predicted small lipoprotein YifL
MYNHSCKVLAVVVIAAVLAGCGSKGPPPAKPGSPEFNWLAAKQAFKTGDYTKAQNLLADVAKKDTPFAAQARPFSMVLSLAMVNAYWELSEKNTEGLKKAKANTALMRRLITDYRSRTATIGLQFAEVSREFIPANKDQDVTLVFELAQAGTNEPQQYSQLEKGFMIPSAEQVGVERSVIQRHLLLVVAAAMNMKKDPLKVKDSWQGGELKVPGKGFLLAMAEGMYGLADMFGPKKLLQPTRVLEVLYGEAKEALELVKDNKEAKDLLAKVTAAQKKLKE